MSLAAWLVCFEAPEEQKEGEYTKDEGQGDQYSCSQKGYGLYGQEVVQEEAKHAYKVLYILQNQFWSFNDTIFAA